MQGEGPGFRMKVPLNGSARRKYQRLAAVKSQAWC